MDSDNLRKLFFVFVVVNSISLVGLLNVDDLNLTCRTVFGGSMFELVLLLPVFGKFKPLLSLVAVCDD